MSSEIDFDKLREERCEVTSMLVYSCDHCRTIATPRPRKAAEAAGILAEYPGRCPVCSEEIEPGFDHITRDPGSAAWVHVECA